MEVRFECVAEGKRLYQVMHFDGETALFTGTPAQCQSRIAELFSLAAREGFTQIALGVPLGPDIPEVIDLWGKEILPALA